jgi:hypothetical protein
LESHHVFKSCGELVGDTCCKVKRVGQKSLSLTLFAGQEKIVRVWEEVTSSCIAAGYTCDNIDEARCKLRRIE